MSNYLKFLVGKKGIAKSALAIGMLAALIGFAVLIVAQTQEDLQDELSQLESDLSSAGYDWLINYTGNVTNVFYENYSCENETGYSTVKVLTEGAHHQLFEFGSVNATAHNWAKNPINLSQGLVLAMHFDNQSAYGENDTHIYDFSGKGNNGTVINQTFAKMISGGKLNGSINFTSATKTNQVVVVADNKSLNVSGSNPGTWAFWMYPMEESGTSAINYIMTRGDSDTRWASYLITFQNKHSGDLTERTIYFGGVNNYVLTQVRSDYQSSYNTWTHVVITWDGVNTAKFYFNGVLNVTNSTGLGTTNFSDFGPTDRALRIGAGYIWGYTNNWYGSLDEVMIFNRTLSDEEIQYLYNMTSTGFRASSLTIWDDTDTVTRYANYSKFYANWTGESGATINGTNYACEFRYNKTGLDWGLYNPVNTTKINMSFNPTTKQYELIADSGYICNSSECHIDGMPVGSYSYNISCFDASGTYANVSLVDNVTITQYNTSMVVNSSTTNADTNTQVTFSANYTRDFAFDVANWPWGKEIGQVVWNTSDLGTLTYSIASFDLDNDGKRDELLIGEANELRAFYSNGTQLGGIWPGETTGYIYETEVFDADNDGYENDVVIAGDINGVIRIFNETGNEVWSSDLGTLTYSVAVLDIDNDGLKDDFVVGAETISNAEYKLMAFNTSDGITWQNVWNGTFSGDTHEIYKIAVGDFDGDSWKDDVAIPNNVGFTLTVFTDNGTMLFNTTSLNWARGVGVVDLDNDGKDEILIDAYGDVYAFEWNGTYGAQMQNVDNDITGYLFKKTEPSGTAYEMQSMDLDNDGFEDDFVIASYGRIDCYNNDSTLLWSFTHSGEESRSMKISDINNDREKEIMVGTSTGKFYVLNRTGSLLLRYTIGQGDISYGYGSSSATSTLDINNDGIPDIAVASENGYGHIFQDAKCEIQYDADGWTNGVNETSATWNNSLVLLFHFNNQSAYGENDTHIYDFSGNQNNGTAYNGTAVCGGSADCPHYNLTNKKLGAASMQFDGVNDYFSIPDSLELDGTPTMSWSFWIKIIDTTANKGIMNKYATSAGGRSYNLYVDTSEDITLTVSSDGGLVETHVATGTNLDTNWNHIAVVFNAGVFDVYKNGQVVIDDGNFVTHTSIYGGTDSLDIGRDYLGNGMNGTLDDVAIWNRTLSADEIWNLYLADAPKYNMTWNISSDRWEYNRTFATGGNFTYGSRCEKGGYEISYTSGNVNVSFSPPAVVFNLPSNNSYYNSSIMYFNFTATDDGGILNATVYGNWSGAWAINNTNQTPVTSGVSNVINVSGIPNGAFIWNVYACDLVGNCQFNATGNYTFNIDTVYPNVNFSGGTSANNSISNQVLVNVSANDTNSVYSMINLDRTLVGWWRMEDSVADGNTSDESGYYNNGSIIGATQTDLGRFGKGFSFNGTTDYISVPANPSLNIISGGMTINAWVKPTSAAVASSYGGIVNRKASIGDGDAGHQYRLHTNNANVLYSTGFGTDVMWSSILSANTWVHLVLVHNITNTNAILYVNGVAQTSQTVPAPSSQNYPLFIGDRNYGTQSFNGTIDEVMIFNRSLSADEVMMLYNATSKLINYTSSVSDGVHNFTGYAVDRAGNLNTTGAYNVTLDKTVPQIDFHSSTPANNSNLSYNSLYVNLSVTETNAKNVTFRLFNSTGLVSNVTNTGGSGSAEEFESTGVSPTGLVLLYHLNNASAYCYDNETKIMTSEGWKYFAELNQNEKVATLNSETGELEWQMPTTWQEFDNQEEMYKIVLEDNSDLLVSKLHKVYSNQNLSSISLGEKTLIPFEDNIPLSPEKIGQLSASDRAIYGASLSCGANCFALGSKRKNSSDGINEILSIRNLCTSSKSCSESLVNFSTFDLFLLTSSSRNSGATNSNLSLMELNKKTEYATPLFISDEITTLASTTNLSDIFYNSSYLLASDLLISSANSSACDCVNLDFETALLNRKILDNLSFNKLPTSKEISTFESVLNSDSSSSGILTLNSAIKRNGDNELYKYFGLEPVTETYERFNSGEEIYFLNKNNQPVKVKSISKVTDYTGKIYDVDVENNIVLVKRNDGIALWSGNSENDTHVYDFSGMGNNGTIGGEGHYNLTNKKLGAAAFESDGNGDFVNVSYTSSLHLTNRTISAWVYLVGARSGTYEPIVKRLNSFNLLVDNNNYLSFSVYVDNGNRGDPSSVSASSVYNQWVHLVGTYNGSDINLYLNGSLIKTTSYTGSVSAYTDSLYIGNSGTPINGSIDEVMIFNRSLSASEILNLYETQAIQYYHNFTNLADNQYWYNATIFDTAGNSNSTSTRKATIDTTFPQIEYSGGTEINYANKSQSNIYINVSVTETNEKNITFNLFNSDGSLNESALGVGTSSQEFESTGVSSTGLVGLWHLNNNWLDSSGLGNDGTATGATFTTSSKLGSHAGSFDGNDYVSLSQKYNNSQNGTISGWFKLNSLPEEDNTSIIWAQGSYANGYHYIYVGVSTNVSAYGGTVMKSRINYGSGGSDWKEVYGSTVLSTGTWYYFTLMQNGSGPVFYVNNIQESITEIGGDWSNQWWNTPMVSAMNEGKFGVFVNNWVYNYYFNGTIDEVTIFNRSLTSDEIALLYEVTASAHSHNFTSLSDGIYYYNVTVTDDANNQNSTSTREITLDDTYPQIEFAGGTAADGASLSQQTIFVNVSVTETNEKNVTFYLFNSTHNNINSTNYTDATHNITWDVTAFGDGIYWYNVTIYDDAGNSNSTATRNITLSVVVPNITLNSPVNYYNSSVSEIIFNCTASDNVALANVTLYGNWSGGWHANYTNTSGANGDDYIFNRTLPDGNYIWGCLATDTSGNVNWSANRTFLVDTTFPQIEYSGGTEINYANKSQSNVYVNVSVTETNEKNITFYLYNSTHGLNTSVTYTPSAAGGIPAGLNLLNNSYGTFEAISDTGTRGGYNVNDIHDNYLTGVAGEEWASDGTSDENVTINLTASYTFDVVEIYPASSDLGPNWSPNKTKIWTSDDGIIWTNITGVVQLWGGITPTDSTPHRLNVGTQTKRYIKLEFIQMIGAGTAIASGEIRIYKNSTNFANLSTSLVTASSTSSGNINYTKDNLIDSDASPSVWLSRDSNGADNVTYNFGEAKTFSTIDLFYRYTFEARNISVYTSADGLTWTNVHNEEFPLYSGEKAYVMQFNFSTQISQYLRLEFKDSTDSIDRVQLYEIRVWESSTSGGTNSVQHYHNFTSLSDGSYYYNVTVTDDANNQNSTSTREITLDMTTPGISITTPSNNTNWSINTVDVNFTISGTNLGSCWYSNDSMSVNTSLGIGGVCSNITSVIWADGQHNVTVWVNNSAGTINKSSVRFTIDTTFPTSTLNAPVNYFNSSSAVVILNCTPSDNIEVRNVSLYGNWSGGWHLNETNYSKINGQEYIFTKTISDGRYKWNCLVTDSANNQKWADSNRTFLVDTLYSTIDFAEPTPANYANLSYNSLFVNISATETNEKNITFYLFDSSVNLVNATTYPDGGRTINWTDLADDVYYYNVTIYDQSDNLNYTSTRQATIDTTYPQISYGTGTEIDNSNFSRNWIYVNVSASDTNEANITFKLYNSTGEVNTTIYETPVRTINWTDLVDNSYWYNVTITDYADNINYTDTYKITLDDTPPVLTIISPDNETTTYSATIDFNVSVSDNIFAIEECYYSLDGAANVSMTKFNETWFNYTYTGITHGLHNLTVSCNDTLDNWAFATESDFNVVLLDLTITNVTYPSIIYSNATFINITVNNTAPPEAVGVNVSCYLDGTIFDSKNISSIAGYGNYVTNCTLTTTSATNKVLNISVDPDNQHPESNEANNNWTVLINITQIGGFDAYDLENDTEDKTGWFALEQEILPDTQTYFFANYTMSNTSEIITGATCNITFAGGSESGTPDFLYNSTAKLYYYNRTFNYAGNYSWISACSRTGFEFLTATSNISLRIPLNQNSSVGILTNKTTVNYNETVNITINIPTGDVDTASSGYNISNVWVQITKPDATKENVSLSGNPAGGLWNRTHTHSGALGTYTLVYYANLTNGFNLRQLAQSNFSVENTSITINSPAIANTTSLINVNGRIRRYNGSDYVDISNNAFTIRLNGVLTSSDTYNHTSFSSGSGTHVNISNIVQLNLTSESSVNNYSDDFSTDKYLTDLNESNSLAHGLYGGDAVLFKGDSMSLPVGNITYKFTSVTKFYNATAYATTYSNPADSGGNTSVWYSFDKLSWNILNSSIISGATIGGTIPANEQTTFYVMFESDTHNLINENPLTNIEINFTNYDYAPLGNYTSPALNIPNITYIALKWSETANDGDIKIQLRESDDGSNWDAWSENYTSPVTNDITGLTKNYLQYRAWLIATNLSRTPILHEVDIDYFNATTNSTGGYNYNITIPTNSLGSLPLEVAISQNDVTGIIGSNSTDIGVWARTNITSSTEHNYSGSAANYSVTANFSRIDTDGLINGTINITISNSSNSWSQACSGSVCTASWLTPTNLAYGNYTINITASNETAYYLNASKGFYDYLEERNTTGTLYISNYTIVDFQMGIDYYLYINASVTNTGKASIINPYIYKRDYPYSSPYVTNITEITPCARIYPGESCNETLMLTIDKTALPSQSPFFVDWRANWTDNDGSIAGGANYISYNNPGMYIIVNPNIIMLVNETNYTTTMQHETSQQFNFKINSTGSHSVEDINITFVEGNITGGYNLSGSWIGIIPNYTAGLTPTSSEDIAVNITIPAQTAPGNYSGAINVSASNENESLINLTVVVPTNTSWYVTPSVNMTYNYSFSLSANGTIANYTIVNLGNVNITINVSYTNSRTTDYHLGAGGIALFETNYQGYNPTSANVTKGGNTTISLFQKGYGTTLTDVGVDTKFYNESGSPTTYIYQDAFNIYDLPPEVANIWFFVNGVQTTAAEYGKNVTIKVQGTDDTGLNKTKDALINISYNGVSTTVNATHLCGTWGECEGFAGSETTVNYTANYTPTWSGAYNATATVYDNSLHSNTSRAYNFTTYGSTTLALAQNLSSVNISTIDLTTKYTFYVNYSANNTGNVYAYDSNLTFSANSTYFAFSPSSYNFSNFSIGQNKSNVFQANVSELTLPGTYNVNATLTWKNPNNSISRDSKIITVIVASNKSFVYSPSLLNYSIAPASINSSLMQINNTGNDFLTSMNLNCISGTLCTAFTVAFNESNFAINPNSSKSVNVSVTVPSGYAAGNYNGVINITETNQSISQNFNIYTTVLESKTWNVSETAIATTKATSYSGNIQEIAINNSGNVNMTFNLTSTNSSLIGTNVTNITVPYGSVGYFMINFTTSATDGVYYENITVINNDSTASPANRTIQINLTASSISVEIVSPTQASPMQNVTAGQTISMLTNASYAGTSVTSGATWTFLINGSYCSNVNSTYDAVNSYWNNTCVAPSAYDGRTHNITANMTHASYGDFSTVAQDAINYSDVTPPVINITRNNINISQNINLQANVTDNVAVSSVSANLIYPNLSVLPIAFTLSDGLYVNNSINLTDYGEYLVNYTANDTSGNANVAEDWFQIYEDYWFEVYDRYFWNITLLDYNSVAVQNANITLQRPNTTEVLLENVTGSTGKVSFFVNKREYDINVKISSDKVIVKDVNFTNQTISQNRSLNLYRLAGEDLSEIIPLYKPFIGFASNSSGFSDSGVIVEFNYSGYNYDIASNLGVVKCANWNYSSRSCLGSWSAVTSGRNGDTKIVQGNSTGFSAYFLAENKCGNGACETNYGETTSTCSADCVSASTTTTTTSSGGGGGGGGISTAQLKKIEEMVKSYLNIGGTKVETVSIYKEVFPGDTTTFRVSLSNSLNSKNTLTLNADGDVAQFLSFESSTIELNPNEGRNILVRVTVPKSTDVGNYDGDLIIKSGSEEGKIPVTIRVMSPEGKLLDVKIQPLAERIAPGEVLKLQTDILNLGKTNKVDVQFDLQLLDVETGEIISRTEEAFAVETTMSEVKNLTIPVYTKPGQYMVKGVAYYSNKEIEGLMQASSIAYVLVQYEFLKRNLFGIKYWIYLASILSLLILIGGNSFLEYMKYKNRRFKMKVEPGKLPSVSSHSGFVGKIAETGIRAFIDLDKLQMHTLFAGSTGSGKTIAAQDFVEEVLKKGKSVIVFDPTAQWTGFLRRGEDSSMMKRYKYFEMKTNEARAFEGTIKTIKDPYELIDIKKYLNRKGEITIFNISALTPKEIDIVVSSTIEQIFKSTPDESKELKSLIVYDEVHRLLPKFGGSGQGFVQLERGAREFRKWGVGLLLISQVLSDFVGEIKANIGTEVQMGTRYEGDLERINMKYGEDILKSVVKQQIGTGMMVNAEYNDGKPYFVSFRPILHSTKRLSNAELARYDEYSNKLEDLEYQIVQLKRLRVDTLDMELELKLSKAKVKSGQFQMADMYLETLAPKVESEWKKIGKQPAHLVKRKITQEEVLKGIQKAKEERAKYIKENPQKVLSLSEKISGIRKIIDTKKRGGKDTSRVEMKLKDLENRTKPFKGKIPEQDAKGIEDELKEITDMLNALADKTK